MSEITLNERNFEAEVLHSDKPVLVDFWAAWCGPCKMLAPELAQVAEQYAGTLKVGKVNVDEEQALAVKYRVMSIPTLLLFQDGKLVKQAVGYHTKAQLEQLLRDNGI